MNRDDYPRTAKRMLGAAKALDSVGASPQPHAQAYLAGYVVECALKSLIQEFLNERSSSHPVDALWDQVKRAAVAAGATKTKLFDKSVARLAPRHKNRLKIAVWNPYHRYDKVGWNATDASTWTAEAELVFTETVAEMIADGDLQPI